MVSVVMCGQWTSDSGQCSILSVAVVNLAVLVIDVAVTVVSLALLVTASCNMVTKHVLRRICGIKMHQCDSVTG